MTKLATRGPRAAATSLALSLACVAALAFPASGLAEEGPVLAFSPSPVAFAKTTVGTVSTTAAVDVFNAGTTAAPIEGVVVEGADAGDFQTTGHNCGQLDPGQHCTVWVAFAPAASGAKQAALTIKLKEAPAQSVQLSGEAVPVRLSFSPGAYDFGVQRVHEGASANLQLTNSGEAPAQLGPVGVGGADTGNFWVNGGDCWGGRWLAPAESCSVQIYFNPWDMVGYQAQAEAYANGTTFTASLAGTGGMAILEPATNPVDFGSATAGTNGEERAIVLTNTGNIEGGFFIGVIAGGDAGSFRLLSEDCTDAPIAPGESCTAHVRFTPQEVGARAARLALFGDGEGGAMVFLAGEGVAPAATLAPSGFDFGTLAAGSKSAGHSFAVRNDGSAPLDLGGVSIVGPDLDQFVLSGDGCSGATLAPGDECLARVRFAPDSAGAKAATLRVVSDAGAFTASLAGVSLGDAEEPAAGGTAAAGATTSSPSRPPRNRGRHRRFARGDDLPGARRARPHRVKVRASVAPR